MNWCLLVEGVLLEETLKKMSAVNKKEMEVEQDGSLGRLGYTKVGFRNVYWPTETLSTTTEAAEFHRPSQSSTITKHYAKRKEHQPSPPPCHNRHQVIPHLIYEAYLQKISSTIRDTRIGKKKRKGGNFSPVKGEVKSYFLFHHWVGIR